MKRQEKLELKKTLLPLLESLFPSQQEGLLGEYPFIKMSDDDIEDDIIIVESPAMPKIRTQDVIPVIGDVQRLSIRSLSMHYNNSGNLVQRIGSSAMNDIDEDRGLYFSMHENAHGHKIHWWIRINDTGRALLVCPAIAEDAGTMERSGYFDAKKLLNSVQGQGIVDYVAKNHTQQFQEYLQQNGYVKVTDLPTPSGYVGGVDPHTVPTDFRFS